MSLGMLSFRRHSNLDVYLNAIYPPIISSQDPDVPISPNASSNAVYDLLQLGILFLPLIALNNPFSALGTAQFVVCPLLHFFDFKEMLT